MINKETPSTHKPKVLFYVQHLLGIGHLKRAVTLSRAMEAGQGLSAVNLANVINTAAAQAKPTPDGIATNGADRSAALLANLIGPGAGAAS
jgi:predicted glycosyltransferase